MQYEEIIKLLDAGYTRDEILAMQDDRKKDDPKKDDPKKDDPKKDDPKKDDPKKDEAGMSDLVKEMREAFKEMQKEFTALNIMSSRQPEEKTPEDIIANIINPTRKKKGE